MRVAWFVAGAAAGVYATARARRAAESLTVDGVHDRLTGWFAGARVLRDEALTQAAGKEAELRARLSVVPDDGAGDRPLDGPRRLELASPRPADQGEDEG